ncbi:MAG TPA: CHASE domain-containing protein [Stellaceae bacterium]|nr:CHASE domain-containing protein [Stellaceae bacterium]
MEPAQAKADAGPHVTPSRDTPLERVARPLSLIAIAVVGVGLSIAVFVLTEQSDSARVRSVLEFRAEWRARDMEEKISDAERSGLVAAAYIASLGIIDSPLLERFVRRTHRANDPASSVSWAPRVDGAQRAAFETSARTGGMPGFEIVDQGSDGSLVRSADRDEYFPILSSARFAGGRAPIGFDAISTPNRRSAALLARDRGTPVGTKLDPLIDRTASPPGFRYRVFSPVYTGDVLPETVEERRATLRGFVVASFAIEDLLREAIADTPPINETITCFIGSDANPVAPAPGFEAAAVYSPDIGKFVGGPAELSAPEADGSRLNRTFDALGGHWTLVFDTSGSEMRALRSTAPYAWLSVGLVVTLFITGYLFRERRRLVQLASLVDQRTSELSSVVRAAPFALITLDPQGRILSWNPAAQRIFGYAAAEVVGRPFEDCPAVLESLERTKSGQSDVGKQIRCKRKDGKDRDVVVSCAPIVRDGAFASLVVALEDVTERLMLEHQLRHAQKMEAIGRLTGGIAHDFNNLLAVVLNSSTVLAMRLEGQQHELAVMCQRAARRGKDLTSRMMSYARQKPLRTEEIAIVDKVTSMLKLLHVTLGEDIEIQTNMAKEVPPALADAGQLENAILNLAINSRDAMEKGGTLTVEVAEAFLDEPYCSAYPDLEPGRYVLIGIGDTGTGMDGDVAARAFDPFFTTKDVGKGTGLGLSMVYGFVKQSNGHVTIMSELGRGTTVKIYLPVAEPKAPATVHDGMEFEAAPTGVEAILVVEDDDLVRGSVLRYIRRLGYMAVEAQDGPTALARLAERPFDLVFSDVVMPGGISGIDLAIKAAEVRPGIKVLLTSGYIDHSIIRDNCMPPGIRLLTKPYEMKELAESLRAALKNGN